MALPPKTLDYVPSSAITAHLASGRDVSPVFCHDKVTSLQRTCNPKASVQPQSEHSDMFPQGPRCPFCGPTGLILSHCQFVYAPGLPYHNSEFGHRTRPPEICACEFSLRGERVARKEQVRPSAPNGAAFAHGPQERMVEDTVACAFVLLSCLRGLAQVHPLMQKGHRVLLRTWVPWRWSTTAGFRTTLGALPSPRPGLILRFTGPFGAPRMEFCRMCVLFHIVAPGVLLSIRSGTSSDWRAPPEHVREPHNPVDQLALVTELLNAEVSKDTHCKNDFLISTPASSSATPLEPTGPRLSSIHSKRWCVMIPEVRPLRHERDVAHIPS